MEQVFMKINQRDLFLVPFPFSDFSGKKVRPVVVVSNDKFNNSFQDIIVCGITSNIDKDFYSVKIGNEYLEEGGLFNPCCVKAVNILKINKKLCIKKIGKVKKETFSSVLEKLDSIF